MLPPACVPCEVTAFTGGFNISLEGVSMTIDVLGTKYTVKTEMPVDGTLGDSAGSCDAYSKSITINEAVLCLDKTIEKDLTDNLSAFMRKVLRHEIIHAFLNESGLRENSEWACNEEMVDWVAIMIPKINKCFEDCNCLE